MALVEATRDTTGLAWDATRRVLRVDYPVNARLTEETATLLIEEGARRLDEGGPVRFLFECSGVKEVTPGHRAVVGRFYRTHRARVRFACLHLNALLRVMANMFGKATGVPIRAFDDEDEALAWACAVEATA